MQRVVARCLAVTISAISILCGVAGAQSVTTYHGSVNRSGNYVFPGLTWADAAGLHLDPNFTATVDGNIYAQPLYWQDAQNNQRLIVATESNNVYALDAATGKIVWQKSLGQPAALSSLPCGDIDPLGITGTPVIDATSGAVYLDAVIDDGSGAEHYLFGLSLADGSILTGFPINVADALKAAGQTFEPKVQNQRGALLIVNQTLLVPYGGHFGDCGAYHGWVLGMNLSNPAGALSIWSTRAQGGGIWAPGGIAYDGTSIYAATGNTFGASVWSDGEAVFRLGTTLARQKSAHDFFAPADWKYLDGNDLDLGGTGPVPIDVSDAKGVAEFVLALGKDGRAYLLNRNNLGGIGGALIARLVSRDAIRTAPAVWAGTDSTLVAFQGRPAANICRGVANPGLTVLRIKAHPPRLSIAWCAPLNGRGAPIVTTLADGSNPIVWITGAEGDNLLHGFRGDNGAAVFDGDALTMAGLRHFGTILAANGRLYVAGDGRIYSFMP